MKSKNLFWGLFFIAAAAVIILSYTGLLGTFSPWSIIIALIILPVLIKSIFRRSFTGIFFSLAIYAILFDKQLGIEYLTPWPVLGIALFLSIGLSLIFPKSHRFTIGHTEFSTDWGKHFGKSSKGTNDAPEIIENMDGEKLWVKTRLSGSVKYVTSQNLKELTIDNSFGGTEVYLDNAKLANGQAVVNIYTSFGGVEIFIPKEWKVINNLSCTFGACEENGSKNTDFDGNVLYIKGDAKFSGVEITRI